MIVLITNITDVPKDEEKFRPSGVRIFNKELRPGLSLRVDARYVDAKMRKLEEAGYISIGKVPTWYQDYKERRRGRVTLSAEDIQANLKTARAKTAAKEAAMRELGIGTTPAPVVSKQPKQVVSLGFSDTVSVPKDVVEIDTKEDSKGRKKKRR